MFPAKRAVLAHTRAVRPTRVPTTAFAGQPTRELNLTDRSDHRSVRGVKVYGIGAVCRIALQALPGTLNPLTTAATASPAAS